jgi:penicillin amidase
MSGRASWIYRSLFLLGMAAVMSCAVRSMPEYEKNPTLPQVSGALQVPGLVGEVKVYRDKWGVPHIFTENEHDMFFADGYIQAQDRLWQIVLFRAVSTGKLSEIFGNVGVPGMDVMGMEVSTLGIDKRMRIMGMNYIGLVGEPLLAKTNPRLLAQMQAFCDGINAFLKQNQDRLPIEFQVLAYEPAPFRPADIISLSRFYGSNLCANMDQELKRYAMSRKLGEDITWKLMPLHESPGPTVVPKEMLKNRLPAPRPLPPGGRPDPSITGFTGEAALELAKSEKMFRTATLFPSYYASNNWVVGPKLTATGTAMLANDPHLLHIEPSLCYTMHMKGAGFDAYGVVFPGSPYIVMGHTRRLSWGATVTSADVQDLFVETVDPKNHPGKYLYKGEWRDFTVRRELIRVRPGIMQRKPAKRYKELEIEIRSTVHGPVINDVTPKLPKDTPPLAQNV